jgi:hypothetical protein
MASDRTSSQDQSWEEVIQFASGMPNMSSELVADKHGADDMQRLLSESWEDILSFAMCKQKESNQSSSDVDTTSVSEAAAEDMPDVGSSSSEDEKEVELGVDSKSHRSDDCAEVLVRDRSFEVKFEGRWTKARISGNVLTWNEGEDVLIHIHSASSFSMVYDGTVYHAELHENGKLHWDDGDVWALAAHANLQQSLPPWLARKRQQRYTKQENEICDSLATDKHREVVAQGPRAKKSFNEEEVVDLLPPWLARSRRHMNSSAKCKPREGVEPDRVEEHIPEVERGRNAEEYVERQPLCLNNPGVKQEEVDNCTHEASRWTCKTKEVSLKAVSRKSYEGVVQWFRGSYGWIACEKLAADHPDLSFDVTIRPKQHAPELQFCGLLVHKSDSDFKPAQGDKVSFVLALNDQGKPQAMKVKRFDALEINARDWFAQQSRTRASRR